MAAIFKIAQAGAVPPIPPGSWDRSRRDLQLFATGGLITLTARDPAVSYLWEIISEPPGSTGVLINATTSVCSARLEVTGGYLIRLTVDAGLAGEDTSVRYLGIALANSGLCIPAFNECDFDNSIDPLAASGFSEKLTTFLKWADANTGGATTIPGGIYIDSTNGSDVTGDGTIGKPYASLNYACSVQIAPPDLATFQFPMVFNMAPGVYLELGTPSIIPHRQFVSIIMNDAVFVGDINWGIDPEIWLTFGLNPLTEFPQLHLSAAHPRLEGDKTYSSLIAGTLTASNDNAGGNLMPRHILGITGISRDSFRIHNSNIGTAVQLDATQTMTLYMQDSYAVDGTCVIAGTADYDVPLDFVEANEVEVYAERSSLTLAGTCRIKHIRDCNYEADCTIDVDGAPYAFGRIHGDVALSVNIERSHQTRAHGSLFGYNSGSPRPYSLATALVFDRSSLVDMSVDSTDLFTSFIGFDAVPTSTDTGNGRGWFLDECKDVNMTSMRIPQGDNFGAARLLYHAYYYAGNVQPDGRALGKNNRFALILEEGTYEFLSTSWLWGTDYVDLIGQGSAVNAPAHDALIECTVLYLDSTSDIGCSAQTARFEGFSIMKDTGGVSDLACLNILDTVHHSDDCDFKDITFLPGPNCAGVDPRAVMIAIPAPPP